MVLTEACASAPGHQPAHIAQTQDLVGRTLDIDYGSRRYELRFIDANTIHWRCVAGDELGAEATEKVVVQATGDGLFHLNWVERSGLGVSELLDTRAGRVHTVLRDGRELIPLSGPAKIR